VGYDFVDTILNPTGGSGGNDVVLISIVFFLNCQDVNTCDLSNNCVL
jgi:hypothetical protein